MYTSCAIHAARAQSVSAAQAGRGEGEALTQSWGGAEAAYIDRSDERAVEPLGLCLPLGSFLGRFVRLIVRHAARSRTLAQRTVAHQLSEDHIAPFAQLPARLA